MLVIYISVKIIHRRVSLLPPGTGFGNVHFLYIYRAQLSGAQLSAPKKWTIGPRGEPPGQPSMYKFHRYYIYSPGGISPNVGSLYPIQIYIKIYITKCTFPNPAPKGSTETL